MDVVIDREYCGNCQLCVDACSEVFDVQEGEVVVICEEVPPALEPDCLFAREACPVQAIELLDSEGVFLDS